MLDWHDSSWSVRCRVYDHSEICVTPSVCEIDSPAHQLKANGTFSTAWLYQSTNSVQCIFKGNVIMVPRGWSLWLWWSPNLSSSPSIRLTFLIFSDVLTTFGWIPMKFSPLNHFGDPPILLLADVSMLTCWTKIEHVDHYNIGYYTCLLKLSLWACCHSSV